MVRIIISTFLSSTRRTACHRHLNGGYVDRDAPHVGRKVTQLMNMQKHRCRISTQAMEISSDTLSYDKSNMKDEEMQAIRIEVISRENIKPSSPTPQNLRYYKLSMFDQAQMSVYHPFTFFYPNNNNSKNVDKVISDRSANLKQSLSQTLTRFYPFAGKVVSELHIDCNDDGVYYTETRVDNCLKNVLKNPDYNSLQRLNPVVDFVSLGSYVSMVQVNFFKCGGVAVSVQHNHKLVDGFSYMMFMKAWAAIARHDQNQVYPKFVSSSMFPQNEKSPSLPIWYLGISPAYLKLGKCVTKRFVFNALSLRELKAKASEHSPVSRINAVLALLWKCVTRVTHSKKSVLHVPVNIRPRCSPPMSEYSVGNIILDTSARFDPDTNDLELGAMAVQLKNVIMDVNSESIEELRGKNMHVKFVNRLRESMEMFSTFGDEHIKTTSVCNLGSNEVDFGWGRPVWLCTGHMNDDSDQIFMNRMMILDSCSGDGIEVWVTLEKHFMDGVMGNPELLSFASVDPSPLCMTGRNKALKTESCGLEDTSSLLRRGLNDAPNMANLQDSIDLHGKFARLDRCQDRVVEGLKQT